MLWLDPPVTSGFEARRLAREYQLSSLLAQVLVNRLGQFEDSTREQFFLNPNLRLLSDPFAVTNLQAAAERIDRALQNKEQIVILGDYDVDGISSTCLLVSLLKRFGGDPHYAVPKRLEEGYGISRDVLTRSFDEAGGKPDLFIALDCGTNAIQEINSLRNDGIDVIVIDHHQNKEATRPDFLLVNPHVYDPEGSPWRNACTVGLVFKLAHGFLKLRREAGDEEAFRYKLKDELDLVALGTVADLVPLEQENRIYVRHGLDLLRETGRPGLVSLMEVAGIRQDRPLETGDISFKIGPRINACGRLDDARIPIQLLLSEDPRECRKLAGTLDTLNSQRQTIEKEMAKQAEVRVKDEGEPGAGIVVFDEDWHPGVVGIVASRLMRAFQRPSIVLGREGELAKGSGRSIPGVDLVAVLEPCGDLLESWGGHPMAVGISLPRENVPIFARRFQESIQTVCAGSLPEQPLQLDGWLPQHCDLVRLLREKELMAPFGMGNPEPIFGIREFHLNQPPEVFGQGHIRFFLNGYGKGLSVIGWNLANRMPPPQRTLDLALRLGWNFWNGRQLPQAELIDWRFTPEG
jgi:single-stranded-DNA-specific exonuclease